MKNPDGKELSDEEKESFNPQGRSFHTFSSDEFYLKDNGTRDYTKLSDAFNNKDIYIIVENPFYDDVIISKEKFLKVIQEHINGDRIKTQIAIFSITEEGTSTLYRILSTRCNRHRAVDVSGFSYKIILQLNQITTFLIPYSPTKFLLTFNSLKYCS